MGTTDDKKMLTAYHNANLDRTKHRTKSSTRLLREDIVPGPGYVAPVQPSAQDVGKAVVHSGLDLFEDMLDGVIQEVEEQQKGSNDPHGMVLRRQIGDELVNLIYRKLMGINSTTGFKHGDRVFGQNEAVEESAGGHHVKENLYFVWEDDYMTRDGEVYSMDDLLKHKLWKLAIRAWNLESDLSDDMLSLPVRLHQPLFVGIKAGTPAIRNSNGTWSCENTHGEVEDNVPGDYITKS